LGFHREVRGEQIPQILRNVEFVGNEGLNSFLGLENFGLELLFLLLGPIGEAVIYSPVNKFFFEVAALAGLDIFELTDPALPDAPEHELEGFLLAVEEDALLLGLIDVWAQEEFSQF